MNDAEWSYEVVVATNLELQRLLCKTLEILALNHPLSGSSDPKIALAEVLGNLIIELRSAIKPFAAEKVFTSNKRDAVIQSIDICSLDSSLILAILLRIEKFLGITRSPGGCSQSHLAACCNSCKHSSKSCKKCVSGAGKSSKNCDHPCESCHQSKEECGNYTVICCKKCNICVACNEKFVVAQMNPPTKKTVFLHPPCTFYLFLHCLKISLNWRNLFGHTTVTDLQNLIDGNTLFKDFSLCKDTQELFAYIKCAFLEIMNYMKDNKTFKNPLKDEEYKEFEKSFDCILQFGKSLKIYLGDNYCEIKKMFGGSADLQSKFQQFEEKIIEYMKIKFDNLNAKVDGIKKSSMEDSKISLTFSIDKKKISFLKYFLAKRLKLFCEAELGVGGKVRSILYDSCVDIMKKNLNLELNKDYHIKKVECDFQEIKKKSTRSRLKFEMKISTKNMERNISNDMMQHAKMLCQVLKSKIEDGVHSKYNLKATAIIYSWEFGSIILKAVVALSQGEFTPTQQTGILDLMKEQVTNSVGHKDIFVNFIPTTEAGYSIVRFSMDIISEKPDVIKKIRDDIQLIEVLLLEKIKVFSKTEETPRDDINQQSSQTFHHQIEVITHAAVGRMEPRSVSRDKPKRHEKARRTVKEIVYEGKCWTFDDVYRVLKEKDFDTFRRLAESDCQVLFMCSGKDNHTLFLHACVLNDSHIAEYLLSNFCEYVDVLAVGSDGKNAFHQASQCGNVDLMRHLLTRNRSGMNIADKNNKGMPLHWAASYNQREMVEFLLSSGADLDICDIESKTPDQLTDDETIQAMLTSHRKKIAREIFENELRTFDDVYRLLKLGEFDTFRKLVENDHRVINMRSGAEDHTLFLHACILNDSNITEYLLSNFYKELYLFVGDSDGKNAFHWASENGNIGLMRHLCEVDPSGINIADEIGMMTPLHWAASCNKREMVEFLLSSGADVGICDIEGDTPDQVTDSATIKWMIASHRMKQDNWQRHATMEYSMVKYT